jgi:hypothetical protein
MGVYLNPNNEAFKKAAMKKIYVDKSLLIEKVWNDSCEVNNCICISRPRRFGKSTDANMLTAFFSKGCDSRELFDDLKISDWENYHKHLNKHNVIHMNMQDFLSRTHNIDKMLQEIDRKVIKDLAIQFPNCSDETDLSSVLDEIFAYEGEGFIFIIDEWDCVFREFKNDKESQRKYLDYLRLIMKDHAYVKLAYMTGILPIKKYGTHSALNMFDEISMIDAKGYSVFMGLTDAEVAELCRQYNADYSKMKEWYNGYQMRGGISTYSPRSVTASVINCDFSNYWSQTETYEALKTYIDLNFDGLKDTVIRLLAGEKAKINVRTFQNSLDSFATKDDILTLLIHLGYLGYIVETGEVYIPNNEVKNTFVDSIETSNWDYISQVFRNSNDLLEATWNMQEKHVASYIENSHYETSILQYNDENALSYTISLAYITAKEYYTIVRELPTGKGFADIVFIPKTDKPAMIVELKFDKDAETGIKQIKDRKYYMGLDNYLGNLLLVAISYDKETKEHMCKIEKF